MLTQGSCPKGKGPNPWLEAVVTGWHLLSGKELGGSDAKRIVTDAVTPSGRQRMHQVAMSPGHGCAVRGTAHLLTMGGATLYLDGIIFAIMVDGELWLKSDAEADPVWDTVSRERFTVTFKDGKVDSMK